MPGPPSFAPPWSSVLLPSRLVPSHRRPLLRVVLLGATLLAATFAAGPARAFSFFDGKLEVHGYVSEQIRGLAKNYSLKDGLDLAQWYNVLNVEVEAKPFPNGLGPIEILEFYTRAEVRYDCVWTHACGMFPSVNAYGNNAQKLPGRLIDGTQAGYTGSLSNADTRFYSTMDRYDYQLGFASPAPGLDHEPMRLSELPGFVSFFGNGKGPNQQFEPIAGYYGDDPPPFALYNYIARCKFGVIDSRGGENDHTFSILGPWNPSCPIEPNAVLRNYPNPFNIRDYNPILTGPDRIPGTGDEPTDPQFPGRPVAPYGRAELPFRPAPFYSADVFAAPRTAAQGLYIPSPALVGEIQNHRLDAIDQNFGQQELAWNRGESQQQTDELKEAYADIEMFEGRLWMRLGKQTIVWGKTELFRNTDQFNPQDLALTTLPTLEESRIALWAARGTWSFYNIGKLEDVRLELALDLDQYKPADLGRCGEPFAAELVCGISIGYFAHGLTGTGLAGRELPPNWWQSPSGLQGGARVEWRYRRFSFQLSDYYGYDPFPYAKRISTYERNVDPYTGRPRRADAYGPCNTGAESACLGRPNAVAFGTDGQPLRAADTNGDGIPDTILQRSDGQVWNTGSLIVDPAHKADVLAWHPANQTEFAFANILCGAAGPTVDAALCGFAAFNGRGGPGAPLLTIANGSSAIIAGSSIAARGAANWGYICTSPATTPAESTACGITIGQNLVLLNLDPGDDVGVFSDGGIGLTSLPGLENTLGQRLTPQQEALFGCGPYYQDDCDTDGIDMLNAEASVLIQSWPGFDGTRGDVYSYDTADASHPQPGTIGFVGGPVATRYVNGHEVVLPGARGVGLDRIHYDPLVDGCSQPLTAASGILHWSQCANARRLVQPQSGQPFQSELAAASWNLLMAVVAGGRTLRDPYHPMIQEFDPTDPYGLRKGTVPVACGIRKPQLCATVSGFLSGIGSRRSSVRAAGTNGYGRRDWAWDSGGEFVLSYQKRNVFGFAFDFDEDHTKSNWGVEATWVNDQPFANNDQFDGITHSSTLNLTVSVDRPTFINFINPGRTVFFNSQWFVQYIPGYHNGFWANGPVNVLATLTALTGYHQDRLLVSATVVYDFLSTSGGLLPSVTYRFNENFSTTVGINTFFGRQQLVKAPINELRPALNRVGENAQSDAVDNGLSAIRDHDEIYMVLRYTF